MEIGKEIAEKNIERYKDSLREAFIKYTIRAFRLLPDMERPRILDVGCGSGLPSMELARLTDGEIIGLDIDRSSLDVFRERIEAAGLSDRVKAMECSLFEMPFTEKSFNIVWAEGSINLIGFTSGIKAWQRLLKEWGYLVVHDGTENLEFKLKQVPVCGYDIVSHFRLPDDVWWIDYFEPLEKRLEELRESYADDPVFLKTLDKEQREVDMYKRDPGSCRSVFIIMRRSTG